MELRKGVPAECAHVCGVYVRECVCVCVGREGENVNSIMQQRCKWDDYVVQIALQKIFFCR